MDQKVLDAATSLTSIYTTFGKQIQLITPFLYGNDAFHNYSAIHYEDLYGSYWYHPDHLGSSSYITNLAGEITQHMEYLPFGETLVEEHLNSYNSPYNFNAKELEEETGNYYYGARYYNPKWSIWLSVDPLAEKYPGWSPYNYTLNNPVRFVDPDGRAPFDWIKSNKTGEYIWRNDVIGISNTPLNYKYIGAKDSDIIYDLFGGTSFTSRAHDMGMISSDDFENPYSARGYAINNMTAYSKMQVSFSADVETSYSQGNLDKNFLGVNIDVSISGNVSAPYPNIDMTLRKNSMTLQGNELNGSKQSPWGNILPGGDVPTLSYSGYWNAKSIQCNFNESFDLNFNFQGNYFDKESGKTMGAFGVFGIFFDNDIEMNNSVKFNNTSDPFLIPLSPNEK